MMSWKLRVKNYKDSDRKRNTMIKQSVGIGAENVPEDVAVVQGLLNGILLRQEAAYPALRVDGLFGPATGDAIQHIQERIVRLQRPDGVVDPDGVTLKVMQRLVSSPAGGADPLGGSGRERAVKLRGDAYPVISAYTENVLRFAMDLAEVEAIDISSTQRRVSDQARIMFDDNRSAADAGKTVREYRGYGYGPVGQAVDAIYAKYAGKLSDTEIMREMAEEIRRALKLGKRVSKHCVEDTDYQNNNILDVPYSGVLPQDKRDEFEGVLISLANSFNKRKYSDESVETGLSDEHSGLRLIDKVIVERSCWHLEIPQDAKEIPLLYA